MTKRLRFSLLFISLILFNSSALFSQFNFPSPSKYLGYELGAQFTPHNEVLGYFKMIAKNSPLVSYKKYGTTYEGRELGVVFVTSRKNQSRLEEIRLNNIKRTGLIEGEPTSKNIAIVWLSYNVHGDEASSSEAAMKTLYELVRPKNAKTKRWLQNTVVIMDPMLNPDGRDRYVHWYNEVSGEENNINSDAREHHQPWPGGRTNHYYFDLNRDWAWLTQKASKQRIEVYQQWMPHIHVDFHEQGINSPYYFAPAAKPYHEAITEWQRQFQVTIGQNHAKYFDKNNWLYFTGEVFDLFYPGYGDTYPLFNGAIGMTYEQAGGGFAGLAVITADGDTLTLKDRLMHHTTTGLSTVEIASKHAEKLVSEFAEYFEKSMTEPRGKYKSYVIWSASSERIQTLLKLLDQHRIRYMHLSRPGSYEGFSYQTGKVETFNVDKGDIVISAYQPKSVLVRVLFEPDPVLQDSLTYDITAWALPYAYGLDAFATTERIEGRRFTTQNVKYEVQNESSGKPYAYLAEWKNFGDVKFLASLLKHNITVRYATKPFRIEGKSYEAGTLIITRNGNTSIGRFDEIIQQAAAKHNEKLYPVSTGFVQSGSDFGSSTIRLVNDPRVALLSGEGTPPSMVGQVWHYFDQQIEYPITLINTDYFNHVDLHDYDVLIFPSANYNEILDDERLSEIKSWIRAGGTLIAMAGANDYLVDKKGFALQKKSAVDSSESEVDESNYKDRLQTYRKRRRMRATQSNPGSVFRVSMDTTHPLAFGYDSTYSSLKLSTDAYAFLKNGWNVGVIKSNAHVSGFIGYKAKNKLKNTLVFGVQPMGSGAVVYMIDNPLFRAFWYNGKLLFGNAVFLVGR